MSSARHNKHLTLYAAYAAGREDPWVAPLYGHRAKRLLPSAVYFELSPAGHCPHHEAPTAVNSIIATFVAAVEAGQQHQHELMQVRCWCYILLQPVINHHVLFV
jgi:hypothetical protein